MDASILFAVREVQDVRFSTVCVCSWVCIEGMCVCIYGSFYANPYYIHRDSSDKTETFWPSMFLFARSYLNTLLLKMAYQDLSPWSFKTHLKAIVWLCRYKQRDSSDCNFTLLYFWSFRIPLLTTYSMWMDFNSCYHLPHLVFIIQDMRKWVVVCAS